MKLITKGHSSIAGKNFFFARWITKPKLLLNRALQFSVDAATPLKISLFLTVQMHQLKMIMIPTS